MKKLLPSLFSSILCLFAVLLMSLGARASHVVGADLYYTWVSGNTYKITVNIYGDCGPSSSGAFSLLPTASPQVCIFNGTTSVTSINLTIQPPSAGVEITPVCPADINNTQCTNTAFSIPGIKKFVYEANYTLPYLSANWRFIFTGQLGASGSAGRAAALTNLPTVPATTMQLEATLNAIGYTNSNPILTLPPTPFYCLDANINCNPGAVDADGDSLSYALVAPKDGGSAGACDTGLGPCAYVITYPYSATNPIHASSFSFDPLTGQMAFVPDALQRSVVVIKVSEYRGGVLIGTSEREMSVTVLTCTGTPPGGGMQTATNGTVDDSSHFHICANSGPFSFTMNAASADPTLHITVSNTGLPAGCTWNVVGNGTATPVATVSWSTVGVTPTPGFYTFYVVFTDDNCPLAHQSTQAMTIAILPIPTVAYSIVTSASCVGDAVVSITPGGLGNPWTVDILNAAGVNIGSHPGVSGTFLDTLAVGNDSIIVYSSLSTFCNSRSALTITQPPFVTPAATFTNPTFCGNNDGTITITGLHPLELDTVKYNFNGVPVAPQAIFSSGAGTITLTGLCAGNYDNLTITYGTCVSAPIGAYLLQNPQFTISYADATDPTKCGFNDGIIRIHGLHPGQIDTIKYLFNGVPQTAVVSYVGIDSTITISNLLQGNYTNFIANTQGACPGTITGCVSNAIAPPPLVAPPITPGFTFTIHQGCKGDSVFFTNTSTPAGLTYRWYFGDGGTDTSANPMHVYATSATASNYNVRLIITNGYCVDSATQNVALHENVNASFISTPDIYICQGNSITFTNGTTGWNTTFAWTFGDGGTSNATDPSHLFANTGSYIVTLIATDGRPCMDTFTKTVQVDSTSKISMTASDSVICKGGQVTFEGTYTSIGLTGVSWTFGDGSGYDNSNPIQHSFETTGNLTVTLTATYRACATAITTRNMRIYPNPNIYLGPDTAICPGSDAIELIDLQNAGNTLASWLWNTGEITPNILATKPGYYSATVTIYGCIATDTVWVANDCYISFPNIFTPNGDGINDYFFPRDYLARGLVEFKMDIYNRWGQLIYETKNTEGLGWDGKYNNVPQPEGVFIYQINAKFKDGQRESKQGNLTLIR